MRAGDLRDSEALVAACGLAMASCWTGGKNQRSHGAHRNAYRPGIDGARGRTVTRTALSSLVRIFAGSSKYVDDADFGVWVGLQHARSVGPVGLVTELL